MSFGFHEQVEEKEENRVKFWYIGYLVKYIYIYIKGTSEKGQTDKKNKDIYIYIHIGPSVIRRKYSLLVYSEEKNLSQKLIVVFFVTFCFYRFFSACFLCL